MVMLYMVVHNNNMRQKLKDVAHSMVFRHIVKKVLESIVQCYMYPHSFLIVSFPMPTRQHMKPQGTMPMSRRKKQDDRVTSHIPKTLQTMGGCW